MNYSVFTAFLVLLGSLASPGLAATDLHHDPVTADELCLSQAPDEAGPLCAGMREALGGVMAQCEGQGADARFCAVLGGNIYGIVQGCYRYGAELDGESRRLCKAADTFVAAAAAYCRILNTDRPAICALAQSDEVSAGSIRRYQASWLHRAHVLQRELSASQAMRDTLYPSTHNSFNVTTNNMPPTVSGSDANQIYPIPQQLDMDIRAIEIDLHWMPSPQDGRFRPTVCHGAQFHAGCSYERSFADELADIRAWLDANPGEVLMIDLENNMNQQPDDYTGADRYAEASANIHAALGDLLFLPGQRYRTDRLAPSCEEGQPLESSIMDLRALGKQVILYSSCTFSHEGQALSFGRADTHLQTGPGSYAGIQALDDCKWSPEQIAKQWVRFYEDGTLVGSSSGAAAPATLDEVREMARCNINVPSLDHLQPFDGRLEALLWSWDTGQPDAALMESSDRRLQTVSNSSGRFELRERKNLHRSVKLKACLDPAQPLAVNGAFNASRWAVAEDCTAPYAYAVPQNGADNELLKQAKQSTGVAEVLLNLEYSPRKGWNWPGR